jgi:hypothetical protein
LNPVLRCWSVNLAGRDLEVPKAGNVVAFASAGAVVGRVGKVEPPTNATAPPVRIKSLLAIPEKKLFLSLIDPPPLEKVSFEEESTLDFEDSSTEKLIVCDAVHISLRRRRQI